MNTNSELQQQTQQYNEKLTTLSDTFFSVLDDFKKYYVFTNKNPEVNEYQNYFMNNKSQLQNINKEVVLLSNDIRKDMELLNNAITRINIQLHDEKELNGELLKLINNLKNSNNGSNLLLDETTAIYNNQYLYNTELLITCIILLVLIVSHK
jgi:hypothetical protein